MHLEISEFIKPRPIESLLFGKSMCLNDFNVQFYHDSVVYMALVFVVQLLYASLVSLLIKGSQ